MKGKTTIIRVDESSFDASALEKSQFSWEAVRN